MFIHLGLPFETKVGNVRLRIVVGDISLQTVSFIHLLECYFTEHYLVDLQMTLHVCLIKLRKWKALRKHCLHGKKAASVFIEAIHQW